MNKLDMLVQLAMQKRVMDADDVKTLAIQVREHEATSVGLASMVKNLKEEVTSLRNRAEAAERERDEAKQAVEVDIIDQARCLSSMIDPIMGDMYCRGWRRALETLEKSIKAGAERP